MSESGVEISVIIPTYNEARNIPILTLRLDEALSGLHYEIIVVDDNSPDRTWEVAEQLSEEYNIRVIRRLTEKGLSSAVLRGMEESHGKVIAVIDADLQHDEKILPKMFGEIDAGGADICIGSRSAPGGSYGEWSRSRLLISKVAALMAKIVLPVTISDPMSGFFAISRDCFEKTAEKINPRGFKILLEFIGRAQNLKTAEVGYTFSNRIHGETKLTASVIRNYLVALYDIRFGHIIPPTFLLYSFVGVTGVIVNLVGFQLGEMIGLPHINTGISKFIDPLYTAAPFGYQLAIISNYLLNNYITFYNRRRKGAVSLLKGFLLFQLISMLGFFIHTGIFQLLHINGFLAGVLPETLRALVNNGCAVVAALVSNYYLNLNFTWGSDER